MKNWNDIKNEFENGLIFLGNGSSIALNKKFVYKDIREYASKNRYINDEVNNVFDKLDTVNFEKVLEYLYKASIVNEILKIDHEKPKKLHDELKNGLINSVRDMHPSYKEIIEDLKKIKKFLDTFKVVIDLNYDLIAYWGIMLDSKGKNFDDFFGQGGILKNHNEIQRIIRKEKIIIYPHGSLFICKSEKSDTIKEGAQSVEEGQELKISGNKSEDILSVIQNTDFLEPVFVAEGTNEQKVEMIKNSHYLGTVLEILPEVKFDSFTFLGFSFNENDEHIVNQLAKGRMGKIKISVSVHENNPGTITDANKMLKSCFRENCEIKFFDVATCGWPQRSEENNN